MLLPKYSIRTLLYLMVGVAIFALLITIAMRGSMIVMGVVVAIGSLFFVALVHAGMFLATALLALSWSGQKPPTKSGSVEEPRAPLPEAPH